MAGMTPHYVRDSIVGREAWSRMVARWGGTDFLVPSNIDSPKGRTLCSCIGDRAAARLIAYAGGSRIYVHAGARDVLRARAVEIRAMRARGMTVAEIAAVEWPMRYSERTVARMLVWGDTCQGSTDPDGAAPSAA